MCKAIEDLINDSKAEGKLEGRNEGIVEGMARGRNEGIAEGIAKGRNEGIAEGVNMGKIDLMSELVRDNFISVKDAAARLDMTEEAFSAILRR